MIKGEKSLGMLSCEDASGVWAVGTTRTGDELCWIECGTFVHGDIGVLLILASRTAIDRPTGRFSTTIGQDEDGFPETIGQDEDGCPEGCPECPETVGQVGSWYCRQPRDAVVERTPYLADTVSELAESAHRQI